MAKGKIDKEAIAVERLLINRVSAKEIAKDLGVSENTVSRWKKKHKVEDQIKANLITSTSLVSNLKQDCYTISQQSVLESRPQTPAETDQILKITKSIEILENKLNIQVTTMVFESFNLWMMNNGHDIAENQTALQMKFSTSLISNE